MKTLIAKYQGIHPGLILAHELKKRKLRKRSFAIALNEHPQTFNEITKARRGITVSQSLKIDEALQLEEGTMFLLQAYYEIAKEKCNHQHDGPSVRKMIFWDTERSKIDWKRQYKAVIERVFERGNEKEKEEIINFYGKETVIKVIGLEHLENNQMPILNHLKNK